MPTNRSFISFAEVKEKVSIPDTLQVFGIVDRFTKKDVYWSGVCPLPQHHHGPRPNSSQFKIDLKNGVWLYKCFGDCQGKPGGAGDVIEFVKAMTGLSDAHVRFWFDEHFGARLSSATPRPIVETSEKKRPARNTLMITRRSPSRQTQNLLMTCRHSSR